MKSILNAGKRMYVDILFGLLVFLIMMLISFSGYSQNVGINNPTPHNKSLLDLTSGDKGLLAPRMTQAQRTAMFPAADPTAKGMLVYQTDLQQGFYYYDGTTWQFLANGTSGWGLTGNAGTTPATNFVGTTDNQDVTFKSNNAEVMRIKPNNKLNISPINATPSYPWAKVSIADENGFNSDIDIRVASGSYSQIIFDQSNGTISAPTKSSNGQWAGTVVGRSHNGNGFENTSAVIFGVDSAVAPGFMRGNIQFQTSGGSQGEKMRINRNGDIGIGTTNPWLRLHVEANAFGVPVSVLRNQNASGFSGTIFLSSTGSNMAHVGYGNPSAFKWADQAYAGSIGNVPFVLTTNDLERMRIDASGNVGIGTTTPTSRLEVAGSVKITDGSQGAGKVLTSDANGLATWQTVNASGLGGWGVTGNTGTAPTTNFMGTTDNQDVVFKTNNIERMRLSSASNRLMIGRTGGGLASAEIDILDTLNNATTFERTINGESRLIFGRLNGSFSAPVKTEQNDMIGIISFMPYDGSGGITTAAMVSFHDAPTGLNDLPTAISFNTTPDGSIAWQERMRISSSGNVGIGTLSPYAKLQVVSNSNSAPSFVVQNQNASGFAGMWLQGTGNTNMAHFGYANPSAPIWANQVYAGSIANIPFVMTTNDTERMRISETGNVGIGNNNPDYPLSFSSTLGDKISLWGGAGNHYGLGIQGNLLQMHSAGIADDIAFGYGSSAAFTENMRIKGNGNVGIGTNNPFSKLHVVSNSSVPVSIQNSITNGYSGLHFLSSTGGFAGHMGYGNTTSATFTNQVYAGSIAAVPFVLTTSNLERMRIDVSGNVGIGNNNPVYPLSFNSSFGDKISLWGGAGNHCGLGVQTNLLQIHTMSNFDDIAFGYGTSSALTETMRIKGNGRVGIGTSTPAAELEVNGYVKLGSNAPAVKMIKLTGTTASTQGGMINIAHGLTPAKILSIDVLVEYTGNSFLHSSYTLNPGYEFNYFTNGTNLTIANVAGNSANILSRPYKVLITYEQ